LTATLPRSVLSDPLSMPIGIQLWAVNEAMQSDPAGTLDQLRRIGYRNVESAGFGRLTAREFRRLLDGAGLACPSAHLNFMNGDLDAIFDDAHTLGAHYAVSAILRPGTGAVLKLGPQLAKAADLMRTMTLDDAKQTAGLANRIGEKAKEAGLQFVYHNHFFEFDDQGNGAIAYNVLLRECDPELVKFEIDCGWMVAAGHSPVDYLEKYPQRFPMIHVKDFRPVGGNDPSTAPPGTRVGVPLGHGFIDYGRIFAAAKLAGLKYYFFEQEGPFGDGMSQLEAAKVSYDYLHSMHR
jgi:sugar phosphate isomerase/epimerase